MAKPRRRRTDRVCYLCLRRRAVRQRCWTCILLGRTGKKKANEIIRRAYDEEERRRHE